MSLDTTYCRHLKLPGFEACTATATPARDTGAHVCNADQLSAVASGLDEVVRVSLVHEATGWITLLPTLLLKFEDAYA